MTNELSTKFIAEKHFGDRYAVGLFDSSVIAFFDELAAACRKEDELAATTKRKSIAPTSAS